MIAFALLMLVAPQELPEQNEEIVVLAQKAKAVRWNWRINDKGALTKCKITRSSGDADVDRIGCEATRVCGAKRFRQMKQMTACIVATRHEMLGTLADERAEARIAGSAQ